MVNQGLRASREAITKPIALQLRKRLPPIVTVADSGTLQPGGIIVHSFLRDKAIYSLVLRTLPAVYLSFSNFDSAARHCRITFAPRPMMANAGGNPRFNRKPTRWWAPVGGEGVITMDAKSPYTGDHSPLIKLDAKEPHGQSVRNSSVPISLGCTACHTGDRR